MAREVIDIRHFTTGVVTNIDEKDIPLDAAYSDLDVDPTAREGILAGRAEDESAVVDYHAKQAVLVQQKDGTHDIVYNDVRNGVLGYQTDFYKGRGGDSGTPDSPVELSGAADTDLVAMVQHNGVVRVGKGGNAAAKPQWIGRIDDTTFRGKYEDEYVITDAELANTVGVPAWYKTMIYTGFWVGVSRFGDRVYKIDTATGAVTTSPVDHRFSKIDALCNEDSGITHVWVGETKGNDYYLHRVSLSTLEITATRTISAMYNDSWNPETYRVSDILHDLNSNSMFLAMTPLQVNAPVRLFKTAYSSISGIATVADISKNINGRGDGNPLYNREGRFCAYINPNYYQAEPVVLGAVNPICLASLHGSRIGLSMDLHVWSSELGQFTTAYYYKADGSTVAVSRVTFIIDPTNTAGHLLWQIIDHRGGVVRGSNWLQGRADAAFDYYLTWQPVGTLGQLVRRTISQDYSTVPPTPNPFNVTGGYAYTQAAGQSTMTAGRCNVVQTNQTSFVIVNNSDVYYQQHADWSNGLLILRSGNGVEISVQEYGDDILDAPGKDVYYGIALEYDSQQLSPIWTGFSVQQNKRKALRLTVTLNATNELNPRVNAIVLYRAFGEANSTGAEEFYRRWARVEAQDVRWIRSVENELSITLDDDYSETGASYEAATGLSEALESSMVHYGLACIANGYMVVGQCYHPDVPDASRMLFRSKAQRFDMFNWATDFVALPSPPTALAVYAGRLWAFDKTRAYRVNVEGMFIEEVVEGVGVEDQRCVVETPEGIYAVNTIGLYRLQGQGKMEVSYPVSDLWSTVENPVLAADESMDTIYVFSTVNGNTSMLVYSRSMNRWDVWTLDSDAEQFFSGVFTGKDGEVYYTAYTDADQNKQYEVCGGVARKSWEWYSREFAFAGQPFKVYRVIVDGTPVPHVTTDRVIDKEILGDGTLEADDREAYKFEFRLHGLGTEEVRSVSVIMRRMIGLR